MLAERLGIARLPGATLGEELRLKLSADTAYQEPGQILRGLVRIGLGECKACSSRVLETIEAKIIARIETIVARRAHIAEVAAEFERVISDYPGDSIRVARGSRVSGLSFGIEQGIATKRRQGPDTEIALRDS